MDFNSVEEVKRKLKELKEKNIPKMSIEHMCKIDKEFERDIKNATEGELKEIAEKLSRYVDFGYNDGKCIFEDRHPVLSWGLIHGIMVDSNTGLDWVRYTYLIIGGERKRYEHTFQYHVDCYSCD